MFLQSGDQNVSLQIKREVEMAVQDSSQLSFIFRSVFLKKCDLIFYNDVS